MKSIRHEFYNTSKSTRIRIIPIGCVHIGAAACDEEKLKRVIKDIESDPDCYWIGGGDLCEFITRRDGRYDPETLAEWVTLKDTADLPSAQANRFLDFIKPIAPKCLGLIEGNHERKLKEYTEHDIHLEIVNGVKRLAGFNDKTKLNLGHNGFITLVFYEGGEGRKEHSSTLRIYCTHGSGSGQTWGGKANKLQKIMWVNDADIFIFWHVHSDLIQPEAIRFLDKNGNVKQKNRYGVLGGSFLNGFVNNGADTYIELVDGLPLAQTLEEIEIRPRTEVPDKKIIVKMYGC